MPADYRIFAPLMLPSEGVDGKGMWGGKYACAVSHTETVSFHMNGISAPNAVAALRLFMPEARRFIDQHVRFCGSE